MIVADTPEKIEAFHLLALRGALRLEAIGLKRRGPSALSVARRKYGIKARTAKAAVTEFTETVLAPRGLV